MSYPYEFDGFPNPFINKRERNEYEELNENENVEKHKKNNINSKIEEKAKIKLKLTRPFQDNDSHPNSKRTKF